MIDEAEPSPRPYSSNPLVYLAQEPTPEESRLAVASGLHSGAHTPFHMLAKVALRLYWITVPLSRMDAAFRRTRRYVLAAASFAAVNLSAVGSWYIHRVESNAAAQERAAALERAIRLYREAADRRIQELQLDVRELRAELLRLSGATPQQPRTSVPVPADSISFAPHRKGTAP